MKPLAMVDPVRYEYVRYALARLVYFNWAVHNNPNDSFYKRQLLMHMDYAEKLLGTETYGLKENQ